MKTLFLSISDRIKAKVPAINWIDFDLGQLEYFENPPVAFPCALIKIEYPHCEDITSTKQQVDAVITIRLAFNPLGETNFTVPAEVRNRALSILDTCEALHDGLQGFETDEFSPLSRSSYEEEIRADGLKVYRYVAGTTFEQ